MCVDPYIVDSNSAYSLNSRIASIVRFGCVFIALESTFVQQKKWNKTCKSSYQMLYVIGHLSAAIIAVVFFFAPTIVRPFLCWNPFLFIVLLETFAWRRLTGLTHLCYQFYFAFLCFSFFRFAHTHQISPEQKHIRLNYSQVNIKINRYCAPHARNLYFCSNW